MSVYDEIRAERERQDEQWGGESHDDGHAAYDWEWLIEKFLAKGATERGASAVAGDGPKDRTTFGTAAWRGRMVQIAALATAGVDWYDRQPYAKERQVHREPPASGIPPVDRRP
jgi:hypothetical protein